MQKSIDKTIAVGMGAGSSTPSLPADKRIVTVEDLFAGSKEILISHQSSLYRLKITRQGKLILNK